MEDLRDRQLSMRDFSVYRYGHFVRGETPTFQVHIKGKLVGDVSACCKWAARSVAIEGDVL